MAAAKLTRYIEAAQISRATLWRLRQGQDTPISPPEAAFQSGGSLSKQGPAANGSHTAVTAADGPQRGES